MNVRILSIWRQVMAPSTTCLILGAIVNIGIVCHSATAQTSEPDVDAFVEALRLAAPPDSLDDGMYSEWQVLPETLQGWSEQCLERSVTPEQFEADPEMARSVVGCVAEWQLAEQFSASGDELTAVRGAACWWMTGEASGCESGFTADYVEQVLNFYQEQLRSPQS